MFLKEVLDIIGGNLVCGTDTKLENFSTNSKEINENDIFVGIKGETIDGSKFYVDALDNGAKGAIINKGFISRLKHIIYS